jgi:hypothetical protein
MWGSLKFDEKEKTPILKFATGGAFLKIGEGYV